MHGLSLTIQISERLYFELIHIIGGIFLMGDDNVESDDEGPTHEVRIKGFNMAKYPLTQNIWKWIMGDNPSYFKGQLKSIDNVSWLDYQHFIQKLNDKTGKHFRLPTDAEWEYAAKGGNYNEGFIYFGSNKLSHVAWYEENSNNETHEVGLQLGNELGLYDMSGNVWEWCEDNWHDNYDGAPVDSRAWLDNPERDTKRVRRGGRCFSEAVNCCPTVRRAISPDFRSDNVGFRLVLPLRPAD